MGNGHGHGHGNMSIQYYLKYARAGGRVEGGQGGQGGGGMWEGSGSGLLSE